jgi:hypothetical protein
MIGVYVTHHVTAALDGINDVLIEQLYRMQRRLKSLSKEERIRLHVVYWTNDEARYGEDLRRRVPQGVEVVFNDRSNRPDTQPSLRNKIVDHARAIGCEAFVLLHNDIRLARGCLEHLIGDWRKAAAQWGKDQTVVSPSYIPYHLGTPHPEAVTNAGFWERLRKNPGVHSRDFMKEWCRERGFEFRNKEVTCPEHSTLTDDGHQLMMFMAGGRFFDAVGPCDENYSGADFDDNDWGIRALMCGKRHLRSTGSLIGHIVSLSFKPATAMPEWLARASDNKKIFIDKWGPIVFDEMMSGEIWSRLHQQQGK